MTKHTFTGVLKRGRRLEIQMYDPQSRRLVTLREVRRMKIRTYVNAHPFVQVVIAAVIGAVLPIVEPAVNSGNLDALNGNLGRAALFAGIAAVLRAVILPLKVTP